MVLGQPVGYIKLWSSLAKPWRRLWGELPYLGPQDYLPPNPKRAGPTIPPGWDHGHSDSYPTSTATPTRHIDTYGNINADGYFDYDSHTDSNLHTYPRFAPDAAVRPTPPPRP